MLTHAKHVFLQRLPRINNLRSLYIPHIADHPAGSNVDTHELALQIVDIVTLQPDIELCYMGLGQKCFEILENTTKPRESTRDSITSTDSRTDRLPGRPRIYDEDTSSDRPSDDDLDVSDDDLEDDESSLSYSDAEDSGTDHDDEEVFRDEDEDYADNVSDSDWETADVRGPRGLKLSPKLRLQEILFYDKVSIFKARHGKL